MKLTKRLCAFNNISQHFRIRNTTRMFRTGFHNFFGEFQQNNQILNSRNNHNKHSSYNNRHNNSSNNLNQNNQNNRNNYNNRYSQNNHNNHYNYNSQTSFYNSHNNYNCDRNSHNTRNNNHHNCYNKSNDHYDKSNKNNIKVHQTNNNNNNSLAVKKLSNDYKSSQHQHPHASISTTITTSDYNRYGENSLSAVTNYFLRSGNFQTLYLHKNNIKEIWTYYTKIKVSKLVYEIGHIFEMKLLIYLIKNNDLIKAKIVTETLKKKNEICYFEWLDNYLKIVNKLFDQDLSGAIELFKKIISNGNKEVIPNKMYSILLTELVKANKTNDAEDFLKLISSVRKMQCKRVSTHYYNILMAGHVKEKKLENALEILQQMSKNNVKPNRSTYNILINLCAKLSKADLAEKLFNKMKSVEIPPNVLSYSGIIEAHGNVMDLDSCIKYFKQMEVADVRPNIYTYCILITAYARAGNFQEAVKWFRHMVILSRIQPNLKNITSLMVALTKDFKNDPALLDKIFGLIRSEGLQSDVVAYTALINAKAKILNLKAAIIAYQQMLKESIKPNIYTYTVLLDASAKLGNFSSTIKIFDDMRKGDIVPNQYTYCVIMNVYANNNQLDKAFEIFDQMRTKGISPDTTCINCLMDACNRLGHVNKVFYLYSIMKSELNIEPDNSTFTIFIDSCSFNNEVYHGIIFFQNLLKQNQTLNVNNFGSFINLLGRHGFSRNILNALRLMKKLSIKPSKYRTILPALNYVYSIGLVEDANEIKKLLIDWIPIKEIPTNTEILEYRRYKLQCLEKMQTKLRNLKHPYKY